MCIRVSADIPGFSKSESEVRQEFIRVFARYNQRIINTCFSSNIARMESIAVAAKKNNRKVALVGRSMRKTIEAAFKNGFIENLSNFIHKICLGTDPIFPVYCFTPIINLFNIKLF